VTATDAIKLGQQLQRMQIARQRLLLRVPFLLLWPMFTFGTLVQITCNRNDKLYNWFYSFNSAAIYTTLNDL